MLEQMVKSIIDKTLKTSYPHLTGPAVVYAEITSARELVITNDRTGETATWHEYTLAVVDRFGNVDEDFPLLPGIKSKKQFLTNAIVSIGLAYGDITPTIIEEVLLL